MDEHDERTGNLMKFSLEVNIYSHIYLIYMCVCVCVFHRRNHAFPFKR